MKTNCLLTLWCLIHMVFSIAIDYRKFGVDFPSRISLRSLRRMRKNSELELKSLMSPFGNEDDMDEKNEVSDQLILLPRNLLKSDILSKLGLDYLNRESHLFNLTQKHQNIVIPKESKNLFIFNTTDNLSIPKKAQNRFVELIQRSAPFNLPEYLKLVNFYAVVPKAHLISKMNSTDNAALKSAYTSGILEISTSRLPIFRRCISENKPMMVFLFNSGTAHEFKDSPSKIMNIKNYITKNKQRASISSFFDSFAYNWIEKISYPSLVRSIFCTTSNMNVDESYCLKVQDNETIHLFPAFYDISRLAKSRHHLVNLHSREDNNDQYMSTDEAIKEASEILYSAAQLINGTVYKFAGERFSNAERYNIDAKSKIHKIQNKLGEIPEILDDIKESLDDENLNPILTANDGLKKLFSNKEEDREGEAVQANGFSSKSSRLRKVGLPGNYEEMKTRIHPKPEGGFMFPASLIKIADSIKATPRKKWYSQVVYSPFKIDEIDTGKSSEDNENPSLHKRLSIFSDDENCDKITWYNIFHYSIFGKPRFCLD